MLVVLSLSITSRAYEIQAQSPVAAHDALRSRGRWSVSSQASALSRPDDQMADSPNVCDRSARSR